MTTWHLDVDMLGAYRNGLADSLLAASIEAHLLACPTCRHRLAAGTTPEDLAASERRWAAVAARVDESRRTPLMRVSVATGPLRGAWVSALALLVLVPVVVTTFVGRGTPTLLLALAPLAPLAAVVVAYRTDLEPAGEIALATPLAGLRLVVRRALVVGAVALPFGIAGALVLGLPLALALGWVLPGLALAAVVLLSGTTRLDPTVVAGTLGCAWALAIGIPSALRRAAADAIAEQVGSAPVQLICLAVTMTALALTVSRRELIAYRRTAS